LRSIARYAATPSEPAAVDQIDLRLLHALSLDARQSQRSLARELGMSAPAVGERLARLERTGVIRGYAVRVDWAALGVPTTVLLTITAEHGHEQGLIMSQLMTIPEVEDVLLVTGDVDMIVRARVRDHTHLRDLLMNRVWQIDGIQRTETALTIAEMPPKNAAADLLTELLRKDERAAEAGNPTTAGSTDWGRPVAVLAPILTAAASAS
jgi:Lrp/AsnC family transcriptional regulator for asnA, asnC and gidA